MKAVIKKKCDPKSIKKATKINAKTEKGGLFKRFLAKVKR